jgi:hypothetical protein
LPFGVLYVVGSSTVADFGCCRCSLFSDSVETLDILRYSETGQSKVKIILLESFFYIKGQGELRRLREYRFICRSIAITR